MKTLPSIYFTAFHGLTLLASAAPAKTASPPYADPSQGREGFAHAGETVNEARLYNFYQRQADYLMALPANQRPDLVPGFPGLDAGKHGHWGKHNQNQYKDDRWNQIDIGSMNSHVTRGNPKQLEVVLKGVNVKLGDGLSTCFDPDSLNYRAIWKGWISFNPFRGGTSRNATITGDVRFSQKEPVVLPDSRYLGLYRHGEQVIFHYRIGNVEILDCPGARDGQFTRTVEVISAGGKASLPSLPGPPPTYGKLAHLTKGAPPAWPETVTTRVTLGTPRPGAPYVVDTFAVPYDNPYQSVMQLSGIAFGPDETIYLSTVAGEIWSVKEVPGRPLELTWKRFASGLNSPVGLHSDKDGLFVMVRGQIIRFHDLNNDGEADYYESYANDFVGYNKSHTHTFGLHRTGDGSFHFTQKEEIMRTSPDRVTRNVGYGVRNSMGIGGSADFFWTGPQEGTWTPASTIIEVQEGHHYGIPHPKDPQPISAPLCFIPRGIDNSVGGFVEITSDRWGPFKGSHVGLSYGACTPYLILRDAQGPKPQGAVVPLEGEFLSGVVRGAFRKSDGQLYVAGLNGWGDYAIKDGCLHRMRYVGGDVHKPTSFQVFQNGIRVDFAMPLDQTAVADEANHLAQQWEYVYSKGYGSPEYSAKSDQVGHDLLTITAVHPLDDPKAFFVEIPALEPTMVVYLRMHLKTAQGTAFKTDLFASPMYPQPHFSFPGAQPAVAGKPLEMAMRVKSAAPGKATPPSTVIEGAREIVVNAITGLQYEQTLLRAKPGEPIALRLVNKDVMPHNLIILSPGSTKKVGTASFKMVAHPNAAEMNYTPKMKEVLHIVPVIDPGKEYVLYFRAPRKEGDYPYICTFPGHWQAMQGILRVR